MVALCHPMDQSPRDFDPWTRTNGVHAFFRSRLRQNRRPGLGKFQWETVYHGVHAFFRWRLCQNRRPPWGNSNGKPFMMAIPQEKAAFTPKPAGGLGKFEAKPVYHGDRETKQDPIGQTIRIGERVRVEETRRDGCYRRSDRRREDQLVVSPFQKVKDLRRLAYSPFFPHSLRDR